MCEKHLETEEVKRKEMPWECLHCGKTYELEYTRGRKCVDLGICEECLREWLEETRREKEGETR